jgi:nucleoside-diphosphate-sugar epimerase
MRSTERQSFNADGIEGIALRYGSLYGPGGATEPMIEMLRRRRLPVPRGGGGITSLIYVEDAATATLAALERGRSGEAYNVVDDEPVAWGSSSERWPRPSAHRRPGRSPAGYSDSCRTRAP